jgi:enterochelin esterase family protein
MKPTLTQLPLGIAPLLTLALALNALAQAPRPPQVQSPVVHPDRTVTFNLRAPNAKKVELSAQFLPANQPLTATTNGLWSITVGPVEPDLYPYAFVVDGLSVADSSNQELFPNERFKNSLVDIPGDKPSLYSVQDVPHGELTYCYYQSKTLKRTRPLLIYTPAGYRDNRKKYPVLYLVSGTTDTEETWFRAGRANFILDNLIARRQAVPMVIVMPYGNMMMGTPQRRKISGINPSSPRAATPG